MSSNPEDSSAEIVDLTAVLAAQKAAQEAAEADVSADDIYPNLEVDPEFRTECPVAYAILMACNDNVSDEALENLNILMSGPAPWDLY